MRKDSSYPDLQRTNLLLCAHYNWHKMKQSDDVLHLVVTPAWLKPSQAGLGSWELFEFLVLFVHMLLCGLPLIRCHKSPDFVICFHWSGNQWDLPRLGMDLLYFYWTANTLIVNGGAVTFSLNTGTKTFIILIILWFAHFYRHTKSSKAAFRGQKERQAFFVCILVCLLAS